MKPAASVATRVLSPGRAVLMAGVLNFVGALSGTAVATTVGKGIIPPELSTQTLVISALIAAIAADSGRPYWDSWAVALENLVVAHGILPADALDAHVSS